jgi:hypothetical protein
MVLRRNMDMHQASNKNEHSSYLDFDYSVAY